MRSSSDWYASTTMRPPTATVSSAAGIARCSTDSSSFTSMRSAWKTRLAGCPCRCTATGVAAVMTASNRTFQSSPYHDYRRADDEVDITRSTAAGIQLDFYGPASSDHAQRFATLFRDDYAYQAMLGTGVTPLYCDDGSQMPLTNGEKQYEARWMIGAVLQVNPAVSTPMQFADRVAATIVEAD